MTTTKVSEIKCTYPELREWVIVGFPFSDPEDITFKVEESLSRDSTFTLKLGRYNNMPTTDYMVGTEKIWLVTSSGVFERTFPEGTWSLEVFLTDCGADVTGVIVRSLYKSVMFEPKVYEESFIYYKSLE